MPDSRAAAARCLQAVVTQGNSLSRQITRDEKRLKAKQRPLYRELCYGSLRYYWQLEGMIQPLLKKPFKAKDQDLFMLALIGAYQLEYLRVPPHAAINSTVDACHKLGKSWAKNLINAVLRNFQRQRDSLFAELSEAQRSAHPEWLYQRLTTAWPEQAENIIAANNGHPPMVLRSNAGEVSREEYLDVLDEHDITADPCCYAPQGIRLRKPVSVEELPGFEQGWVSVQDESAQLAAVLLDARNGERVLDACAAPGGKACHILELQPEVQVQALDIDESRLSRVADNLDRLQLQAELVCGDATTPEQWWDKQLYDRILLDAPCSATGVIRRNPDIKIHRQAEDITALSQLQAQLLDVLWPTLKPGGSLLYATCSVMPEENSDVISAFLKRCPEAELDDFDAEWGIAQTAGRQLLPQADGADGFYYARLKKRT